ncbi:MAG: MerR family transcriptional regulator [Halanaerobiales bacterium]
MVVKKNIPMRVVKEETGLTSRQIRYYDETGLVFPERTKGNQRLFSEEDISRMKKIKSLLDEGYTIEAIKNKLNQPKPVKSNSVNLKSDRWSNRINKGDLSSKFPVSNKLNKAKK